jgi:predicted DsbA family dithiol-disulfide isomerase
MHDLIFENQRRLDDRMLLRSAEQAGADPALVAADLAEGRYRELVRDSVRSGARSGVNGTPTLFIEGVRYDGPREEETLVAVLEGVAVEEEARRLRRVGALLPDDR